MTWLMPSGGVACGLWMTQKISLYSKKQKTYTTGMNDDAFFRGFLKRAEAYGLNQADAFAVYKLASEAWTRKEGKNPNGGLNAKGRASYNRAHGANLKPPAPHPKTEEAKGRRKSFCARMSGVRGPMKDEKGRPTRKALALGAWNC